MSKPVKELIMRTYRDRLEGTEDALVVSVRGLGAINNNRFRRRLATKQIHVTVVRNSLARKAFEGSGLSALGPVLEGPSALVYGGQSVVEVAREIIESLTEFPEVELKGAVLDGQLFEGADEVKRLSKFPTRDEAIAQTVTIILSPARKLVASVLGPGKKVASLVKSIEEKLEKGEAIARTA